ncbi:helix-turn-helix domain-containing protein [Tunicatimonas pelagia]|uniref:helix-turn-helix domain-containing protein n=1 Tax=Tunicatimonas pelagia TaxID=931531 RepID=UPI002665823E|nr:helix-turn-helix domain-containing protein [Tunicatimonas pelagia]WKN41498.1 helix-turn-helix domain-containing protein [Tunicatimonas pelagia]
MKIFDTISEYLDVLEIEHGSEAGDLFVFKIEDYFGDRSFEVGPYRHNFFEISYGQGHDVDVQVGDASFNPSDKMLSFSTPFNISSWRINSFQDNSLGYMLLFKPEILNKTYHRIDLYRNFQFFNINTSPALALADEESTMITGLMGTILQEFQERTSTSSSTILSAYLTILLEKANNLYQQPNAQLVFSNRAEEIAFLFESLLKEKVSYQRHLGDYAAELNISTSYLSESVKKTTGKSAKAVAKEFLMLNAKAELSQNKDTIATVAERLGFNDTSNFITFFRTEAGLTPNQYRKSP